MDTAASSRASVAVTSDGKVQNVPCLNVNVKFLIATAMADARIEGNAFVSPASLVPPVRRVRTSSDAYRR